MGCVTDQELVGPEGIPKHMTGLSAKPQAPSQLTKHVVTRWYRAPELILLASQYSAAIDAW